MIGSGLANGPSLRSHFVPPWDEAEKQKGVKRMEQYTVYMYNDHGEKRAVKECHSYSNAQKFCEDHAWSMRNDETGVVWDLDFVE